MRSSCRGVDRRHVLHVTQAYTVGVLYIIHVHVVQNPITRCVEVIAYFFVLQCSDFGISPVSVYLKNVFNLNDKYYIRVRKIVTKF